MTMPPYRTHQSPYGPPAPPIAYPQFPTAEYPQGYNGWRPPYQPMPPRRDNTVRNVLLIIGGIFAALVLFASCAGGTSSGSRSSAGAADAAATAALAKIGEPVTAGQFEITVVKVESGITNSGGLFGGETPQGQFVAVYVTVKNTSNKPQSFDTYQQTLLDDQGREFSNDSSAEWDMDDSASRSEKINPGNQRDFVIVFDIPNDVAPKSIELRDSYFRDPVLVELV